MARIITALALTILGSSHPVSSTSPTFDLVAGNVDQHARFELATTRFAETGLILPDLTVRFHQDEGSCKGADGYFATAEWTIHLCADDGVVFEHELAHAWARHNLTDDDRHAFVEAFGYETWNDHEHDWNQRATEFAAVSIQQGLTGLPLPAVPSPTHLERVAAYEALTGTTSPQHEAWLATHGDAVGTIYDS